MTENDTTFTVEEIEKLVEFSPIGAAVSAVGKTAGALSSLGRNLKSWGNANGLYMDFKKWAKKPGSQTDLKYVQTFLENAGFDANQIRAAAKVWKAKAGISAKAVAASTGSAGKNQPAAISDAQIQQLFKIIFAQAAEADTSVTSKSKRKKDFSKYVDNFDKDFEEILKSAKQFGLQDPEGFVKAMKNVDWKDAKADPAALKALAAIGFTMLRW